MATHSSILAWRIPQTEEPGGPQSMGLQRVRHDRATNTQAEADGAPTAELGLDQGRGTLAVSTHLPRARPGDMAGAS